MARALPERFWGKVSKRGKCWEWTGARRQGRGEIWAGGKIQIASRVAYELQVGPIPAGKFVLHHCDNPACVRAAHLFLGDHKVNMRDMVRKGRGRLPDNQGAKNSQAKLTLTEVRVIKWKLRQGVPRAALAASYGVSRSAIVDIDLGRRWKEALRVVACAA